jgi:hypothetical protein
MKFFLLLTLFTALAIAGDSGQEAKFLVKSVDGTDVSTLKGPMVKVLPPHRAIAYASGLPTVAERDKVFQDSGLSKALEEWDDFDKDSLYLKLKKKGSAPIERILLKFPELPRTALEKAQKEIAKDEQ